MSVTPAHPLTTDGRPPHLDGRDAPAPARHAAGHLRVRVAAPGAGTSGGSGCVRVSLEGELDVSTAHVVSTAAIRYLTAADLDGSRVVVDLRDLAFCDVVGMRALVQACSLAEAAGAQVLVTDAAPLVRLLVQHMSPPGAADRWLSHGGHESRRAGGVTEIFVPANPSGLALGRVARQVRSALPRGDVQVDAAAAASWGPGPRLVMEQLRRLTGAAGRVWFDTALAT